MSQCIAGLFRVVLLGGALLTVAASSVAAAGPGPGGGPSAVGSGAGLGGWGGPAGFSGGFGSIGWGSYGNYHGFYPGGYSGTYDTGSAPYRDSFPSYNTTPAYPPYISPYRPSVSPSVSVGSPAPADAPARITVNVPPRARLWFSDSATSSTGPVRTFHSPALTPGQQYLYDVRATWQDGEREVTQVQQVAVTAGAQMTVTFPIPGATPGPIPMR